MNQNPILEHGALDLNPSLDAFEVAHLDGPPWMITSHVSKTEKISYQNASSLTLEFFRADSSGKYKRVDCIPCRKNMMSIKENGHFYNDIKSHFNGKVHRARSLGLSKPHKRYKHPKTNKNQLKKVNENLTSTTGDDEPEAQNKKRKNKKHKHKKKEEVRAKVREKLQKFVLEGPIT